MRSARQRGGWASAIVGAVLIAACAAPKPAIRTNVDKAANFSTYRTFSFVPQTGTDRGGYSTLIGGYFREAVQREMQARGYQYADEKSGAAADLLVNFNTNVRSETDVQTYSVPGYGAPGYGGYYGYRYGYYGGMGGQEVSTTHYKVGTVNIDVVDASRKQVVWEGVAEGELTDKMMKDPQAAISKVVTALFETFPGV